MDGNTNPFLKEPRIVEEFLRGIEPKYNAAVHKLHNDDISAEVIYVISGFVCYIQSIAPAGMRIHSEPLKKSLEIGARVLDAQGKFPKSPDELGNKSVSELLSSGEIFLQVDSRYPQALGVDGLLKRLSIFGNSHWEILLNDGNDTPFFTSDYPVVVERSKSVWYIAHRIIPLTPNIAVRIIPDINLRGKEVDLSFQKFSRKIRRLNYRDAIYVNRLIVRCAENLLFSLTILLGFGHL